MKQSIRIAIALAAFLFLSFSKATPAQQGPATRDPLVKEAGIYCTGYISEVAPRADLLVIGGEKENEMHGYYQGDVVYLNKGRAAGVLAGAVYYITRPMGEVNHPFVKKTKVGHFVRELGMLQVIEVHERTSTAQVTISCDTIELGDVLRPYEALQSPSVKDSAPMPRYSEGNNGLIGQIIMSPIYREYLSANHLVFIDLGNRQGVRPGDHFTIYRPITRGEGIAKTPNDDIVQERSSGYGSRRFKGGDFSSSSAYMTRDKVMRARPPLPRKVMGELVVLKVENTAAVALITRTTAEVNIGDFIERAN
jgi:hypothetical protein